jgi:hypothetical protein
MPGGLQGQFAVVYYADRNIAQGREAARSSVEIGVTKPVMGDRAEVIVSVSDLFNDFGIRQQIDGDGFDAVYENLFESQVVTVGFKYQF